MAPKPRLRSGGAFISLERLLLHRSLLLLRLPAALTRTQEAAPLSRLFLSLPSEQHETRLAELANRLNEDVAAIRDDFTVFVGMESRAASTDPWNVEPWPDPVEILAKA